ncbi:hypothetical protein MTX78_07640 [Hymenobacter tibetensis]|uniref:Uncharacterized protein n=1 Tax=Hymenobacter tibetensis TaxID=497967 RepID=A0ABY4D297_9BACT|nr:hypothetical protein [Hymenobacter tibetensis]UOG76462.1 hypothetical protein MTX78_07640 [Hymenobacter tibetensis]
MSIDILLEKPNVSISFDNANRWLYLDWHGDLTLSSVQECCVAVAQCFLSQNCTRILNDNSNVTSITSDVGAWLATEYFPHMQMAGVEYMAWVYSAGVDIQCCTDVALYNISSPVVALFSDIASAYSWLCAVKFKSPIFTKAAKTTVYRNQQELKTYVSSFVVSSMYVY